MNSDASDPELDPLWAELQSHLQTGNSSEVRRALADLRGRIERRDPADPATAHHMAEALFCAAGQAMGAGDHAAAESSYRAALPFAVRALEARPDDHARRDRVASVHYNLGTVYSNTGRPDQADAEYRAALPLQEQNARAKPDLHYLRNHLAQTHFNLGNSLMERRRGREAAAEFKAARELWRLLAYEEPRHAEHAHNLARSYFNFAFVAGWEGATPETLDAYHRGQETWERLLREFGENVEQRHDLARCYFNHSMLLVQSGRHDEAIATMERTLPHFDRLVEAAPRERGFAALRQQAHEQRDRLVVNHPTQLAARQIAEGERRAASARAAGEWQRLRDIGSSHLDLARHLCKTHRPVEMERVYRAATGFVAEAAAADPSPDSAHLEAAIWFDLNIDLRALLLYDGAEHAVRTALGKWRGLHARHPADPRFRHWLAGAYNNLGIIGADTGRSQAAELHYQKALEMREAAARDNPGDPENQLFLGGALCNLGNVYLDRGELTTARDFYQRAVATIEPVRGALQGNNLVDQFLKNSNDGLHECATRSPVDFTRFQSATTGWSPPGPGPLTFTESDPALLAALQRADALRLAEDEAADRATEELVNTAPDCAEAWLLRGLVLGQFGTEKGGKSVPWEGDRHENTTAAFYTALVCRPDYYEAKLYKGLALRQAAHAAQAGVRAMHGAAENLPEAEREALLTPRRRRYRSDLARSRESLEAAARLRPGDGRPWYELAELFDGLGYRDEALHYLERLRQVDPQWWEQARATLAPKEGEPAG